MRMLLAEYFRRLGYEVEEYESGERGLEPAVSGNFDFFIFDVTMEPGMSGLELLKRVRARRRDARDVPDRARRRGRQGRGLSGGRGRLPRETLQPARAGSQGRGPAPARDRKS